MTEDKTIATPAATTEIKKVAPVNKQEYDTKIDALLEEVKEIKGKMDVLAKKITEKSTGKEEFFRQRDEMKASVDEVRAVIKELEAERSRLFEKSKKLIEEQRSTREEFRNMSNKLGFKSEEEVNQAIADLEHQIHTESLSLKKEKDLVQKINQLQATKPKIAKMTRMESAMKKGSEVDEVGALRAEEEKVKKKLGEARDLRNQRTAELDKLVTARKAATAGLPELFEEKKGLNDQVKEKYDAIRALRDEKSAKIREYNEFIREQRRIRAERDEKYREARDAESERRKIEDELEREDELPYVEEVDLIENTIKYCRSLAPSTKVEAEVAPKAAVEAVAGATVLVPKKEREMEFFFAPTVSKSKKGKKQKGGDAAAGESKALKHSLATLQLFEKLKVAVPVCGKDLTKTIEVLDKKLADYKEKQIEEVKFRKANRAVKEAQLAEAAQKAKAAMEDADQAVRRAQALDR